MRRPRLPATLATTMMTGALLIPGPQGPRPWSHARQVRYTGVQAVIAVPDFGSYEETRRGGLKIRGQVRVTWDECTDERATGHSTVTINADLNSTMVGRLWGTYRMESVVEGGYWEGSWTGRIYPDGTQAFSGSSRGRGEFEGMLAFFETSYPPDEYGLPGIVGDIEGRILEVRRRFR